MTQLDRFRAYVQERLGHAPPDAVLRKALNPADDDADRARQVDLIRLPDGIDGTNCGNCLWVREAGDGHFCAHPQIRLAVTARDCCSLWDADGVDRSMQEADESSTQKDWHPSDVMGSCECGHHRDDHKGGVTVCRLCDCLDYRVVNDGVEAKGWHVHKGSGPHKFSTTQVNLDDGGYSRSQGSPVSDVLDMMDRIAEGDLAEDGREDTLHITVKYGLHADNAGPVRQLVESFGPIIVTLGKTSLFNSDDHDVVKIDVDSPDLERLNALVSRLPNTETWPEYSPHVTLAYVKPGMGQKYVGWDDVDGMELNFTEIIFSDPAGNHTAIPTASYEWAEKGLLGDGTFDDTTLVGSQYEGETTDVGEIYQMSPDEKGLIGDTLQAAGRWAAGKWEQLEQRYGRRQALAMVVAMVATAALPFSIPAIIGAAEAARGIAGWSAKLGADMGNPAHKEMEQLEQIDGITRAPLADPRGDSEGDSPWLAGAAMGGG